MRWPAEPACLLLGFSGYMYRDVLEPVRRYLDKDLKMKCVVLSDDGRFQQSAVKLSGDDIQSIWSHWNSPVSADEKKAYSKLREVLKEVRIEHLLPALDSNEQQTIWPRLEPTFKWLWMVYLPSLIPYLVLAKHILKAHPNAVIISPDQADPRIRLFCAIGRLYGIPCLEVQFGVCGMESVEWQFFACDRLAVWGNTARQVVSDHGVPARCITVSGSPRYDSLANSSREQLVNVKARLGISAGNAMVLFASHPSPAYYKDSGNSTGKPRSIQQVVFQAADRLPGMTLVVKPHPLENMLETKKLAEGYKNIIFVDKSEDIRELTKACDVYITLGSTATMDALVGRKLVIYPSFPGFVWWDDMYLKNNVAVVAKSEEELIDKLKEAVGERGGAMLDEMEPARQRFLSDFIHHTDGRAAMRIAMLAKEMAGL